MHEPETRHPGRPVILTAQDAVALVKEGDTLAIGGSGGGLLEPDQLIQELGRRYRESGGPGNLQLVHTTGIGDRAGGGMDHLAQPGLARRIIAGNWGMAPKMSKMAADGDFEAYNFPQGVMSQLFRDIAGGRPGTLTHVGIGTFCDPRVEGGKLNTRTTDELVSVITINDQDWLLYPALPLDVCFIRGTTADENGYISCEEEAARLEMLAIAQATHNSGGLVIAQVKYLAQAGTIDSRNVVIPGICVDVVVVNPHQRQVVTHDYNPAFSGAITGALSALPTFPLDQRKVVARRALKEIRDGDIVNLGVGIADGVAAVAAEEGWIQDFTLTIEQGLVGGVPARGVIFGVATNPAAILDQPAQFDFYDGGGLDICFLGFAEIDRAGNVNVSKFGGKIVGTGGFVNISQNASTVVFCGTLTAGGLDARVGDGELRVDTEGRHRKFVDEVEQITFSATEARRRGQHVLYVTERAVFRLGDNGIVLTEIAPGAELHRDVLDIVGDIPVDPNLALMDAAIFREQPLGPLWRSRGNGQLQPPSPASPLPVPAAELPTEEAFS
jgi:acyl CoA:acetate/3-ketoacid CoA transferase